MIQDAGCHHPGTALEPRALLDDGEGEEGVHPPVRPSTTSINKSGFFLTWRISFFLVVFLHHSRVLISMNYNYWAVFLKRYIPQRCSCFWDPRVLSPRSLQCLLPTIPTFPLSPDENHPKYSFIRFFLNQGLSQVFPSMHPQIIQEFLLFSNVSSDLERKTFYKMLSINIPSFTTPRCPV